MASEVEISNLALAHLGDDATVASLYPPEGSAQAEHCARFYPVARDALLEMHAWHFATKRATPAAISGTWAPWLYAYAAPSDAVRVFAVLPPGGEDTDTQPFERETSGTGQSIILTDQETARVRYVARVTDPTRFSPLFTAALSRLLASYLAGPVIKGDTGIKVGEAQLAIAYRLVGQAAASDANQRKGDAAHTPAWISGR